MKHKRTSAWLVVAALALAWAASPAQAQTRLGPQVELFDFDELGIGARVDFDLTRPFGIRGGFFDGLFGSVNGSILFTGPDTGFTLNANMAVPLQVRGTVDPYIGLGINHVRGPGGGSASGLNILGGLFFQMGRFPGFAELRFSTAGSGYISLTAGAFF